MAEHPHLLLPRAEVNLERRKRPGFGSRTPRDNAPHASTIRTAVDEVLARRMRVSASGINPSLIVKVKTSGAVPDEEWERAGLEVLGTDTDQSVILFSSDS